MNNRDIRWGCFGRRPRRETCGCVIHNKRLTTPECAQNSHSQKGCVYSGVCVSRLVSIPNTQQRMSRLFINEP